MPLPNCQFELVAPEVWQCKHCGFEWKDRHGHGKAPHKNCEAAPDAPTLTARVLVDVLAFETDNTRTEATIRKLLAKCEANDCKLYDSRIGCTWGQSCKRYQRWVKRLASGQCEPWNGLLEEPYEPQRVG